ncbi:MAG TPA: tetratricopeptide repeat protein [Pyrinomonadaceae bacterium]|jgi:tetratricopeptide (TPR) repeat protein|nr:tetratricopeptide repeat protein [Pyrinomonadaceae bacterium]
MNAIPFINSSPRPRVLACLCLLCALTALFSQDAPGQRRRAPRPSATPAAPPAQNASPGEFERLAAEATSAREGDRADEALAAYRKALAVRPQWAEGWWYLATLLYDRDNYREAADAFRQTVRLQPKAGAGWAMLGLCEFQLARYDDALTHIHQGRQLGVSDNVELTRVMRYHEGLISILKGEFERGQQTLGTLSYEGVKSEDLIIALGLSVLRVGLTPKQIDLNYRDRDLIRRAGLAEHFAAQKNMSDAQREYDLLARDHAKVANVQYAYGRFLLANRDEDGALAAFLRELDNWPKHVLARCQIANIKLQRKDIQGGLPYAEEAAKQAPRLPLAHYLLGRLLLEAGQNDRAIQALETAAKMVPDEAKTYFALARAYTRAKRKADADRARETFTRLSKEATRDDGQASGSALPDDTAAPEKPPER